MEDPDRELDDAALHADRRASRYAAAGKALLLISCWPLMFGLIKAFSLYVDPGGYQPILFGIIFIFVGFTLILSVGLFRGQRWAAFVGVVLTVALMAPWALTREPAALCLVAPLLLQLILLCRAALTRAPRQAFGGPPAPRRRSVFGNYALTAGALAVLAGGTLAGVGWLNQRAAQVIYEDQWREAEGEGFVVEFPGVPRDGNFLLADVRVSSGLEYDNYWYRFEVVHFESPKALGAGLPETQADLEEIAGETMWRLAGR